MQNKPWHTLTIESSFEQSQSQPGGLTSDEVQKRLAQFGPNELQAARRISPWEILLEQFKNVLILILLGATVLSLFLGHATATLVPPPTVPPQPEIVPPQASINAPSSSFIGERVKIDASGSRPGSSPIVSYTWSFGNGTGQPASPNPTTTAIYNTTGMYEITVVVADANGQTSSATAIITINARLDARAWTLSTINGQPLLPGSAITLQFLSGQLAGFASCNDYNGSYTAVDNGDGTYGVTVDRLNTGRRSCPQDVMTQEDSFTDVLQTASSAAIQENMLTLSGPNGQLVFFLITGP